MPAPSPARCSRLTRMVSASSTILCDLRPLISAINPTPQESFSSAGSNKPKPDASIISLAFRGEPPKHAVTGFDAHRPAPPSLPFPHRGKGRQDRARGRATHLGGNLRAAWADRQLLVNVASFRNPARPRRGSQNGTAMLSYAEHGKFWMPIQASDPFPARVSARVP